MQCTKVPHYGTKKTKQQARLDEVGLYIPIAFLCGPSFAGFLIDFPAPQWRFLNHCFGFTLIPKIATISDLQQRLSLPVQLVMSKNTLRKRSTSCGFPVNRKVAESFNSNGMRLNSSMDNQSL